MKAFIKKVHGFNSKNFGHLYSVNQEKQNSPIQKLTSGTMPPWDSSHL